MTESQRVNHDKKLSEEPFNNGVSHKSRRRNKERRVPAAVMVLAFIFVAGLGYVGGMVGSAFSGGGISSLLGKDDLDLSSVQETYRALKANYDGELSQDKLVEGANRGMVNAVGDDYTVYMNSQESSDFDKSLSGDIGGGIGVEIGLRSDIPTVLRVLADNPAEKAGVQVNDMIIEVNNESTEGLSTSEVANKIRGEEGTSVKVTMNRSGEVKEFSITRERVNNPSAYGKVINGVGVMNVIRFDNNTASLVRALARDFKSQGVKGVVLDLRGNGGGYITASQEVAGVWLDKKVVVTERQNGRVIEELKSGGNTILEGVPTVVILNESSASASEIVAGALRDHKAATLVGDTTFGKGSVQKLLDLSDGSTLKVTIARWYTPSGVNISETGIKPDKEVSRTAEDINSGKDPQLDAALKLF